MANGRMGLDTRGAAGVSSGQQGQGSSGRPVTAGGARGKRRERRGTLAPPTLAVSVWVSPTIFPQ